ncbi:MAG: hypothetical protein NBV67_15890 [Tagaea sp.]|nr:hypothetical protein [Tagaea sp.]
MASFASVHACGRGNGDAVDDTAAWHNHDAMKDKWLWLAVPLAVLVGGLNFVWWFQSETNKAESCRYLRKATNSPDPRWPRFGEMLLANSLMRGLCHKPDVARGIEMFERLIAEGAGDYMAVHYYLALQHVGDEERMARWLNPAAAARRVYRVPMLEVFPSLMDIPKEIESRSAWMFAGTNGDREERVLGIVREITSRPFATRTAERAILDGALRNLRRLDPVEGAFQTSFAMANGFTAQNDPNARLELLSAAAECGHVRAIVGRARQWLDGELRPGPDAVPDIVATLAVLGRFGGIDPALLDAAIAKSGATLETALGGGTPETYRDAMESRCTAKFGAAATFRIPR